MEANGFSFEAAEASVIMMLKRQQKDYKPPFELIDFTVVVEHRDKRGIFAEATVKVMVDGEVLHTAAEGNGPVNALDAASGKPLLTIIRKFHNSSCPTIKSVSWTGKVGQGLQPVF